MYSQKGKLKTPESSDVCFVVTVTEVDESNFNDEEQAFSCNMTESATAIKEIEVIRLDNWESLSYKKEIERNGFYNIYFINGERVKNNQYMVVPVDFSMRIVNFNEGGKYLSVGKLPLPKLYLFFTFIYFALIGVWVFNCLGRKEVKVQLIHWLMTGLLVLKTVSLLFKSVN